jgi:hypothetical protein
VIREAITAHCDALLQQRLELRLADVVGVVESEGGRARATGKEFAQLLQRRRNTAKS